MLHARACMQMHLACGIFFIVLPLIKIVCSDYPAKSMSPPGIADAKESHLFRTTDRNQFLRMRRHACSAGLVAIFRLQMRPLLRLLLMRTTMALPRG